MAVTFHPTSHVEGTTLQTIATHTSLGIAVIIQMLKLTYTPSLLGIWVLLTQKIYRGGSECHAFLTMCASGQGISHTRLLSAEGCLASV
ncbi:hypothetical protein CC2G_014050 [Coprinopsis cinerea AmutBmut pab1-1]|nr:hypothetical protein CC2G_014050 [Coprinopsis cinerea AmutBmut pab1-1]